MAHPNSYVDLNESPRLGEILLARGNISKVDLNDALKMQQNRDSMLGEILIAHGLAEKVKVETALDLQFDGLCLNISSALLDPDLLAEVDAAICLKYQFVPWRKIDGAVLVALADPTNPVILAKISDIWGDSAVPVRVKPLIIQQIIEKSFAAELIQDARLRCTEEYSCRNIGKRLTGLTGIIIFLTIAGLITAAPTAAFLAIFVWAMLVNVATTILRGSALFAFFFRKDRQHKRPRNLTRLSDFQKRPKVSVLLPLFHENRVLDSLLNALEKLTYPKELLDIKILLEEEDTITAAAVAARVLPDWITVITAPKDILQTKPRAMNYALPFCKGDIIGIYDAEDRPDPDQIDKVVTHLMAAPKEVGSVQCFLDFYNSNSNWMARCFTIEYAVWFRVMMRGLQRLGVPLPLGGTSVFTRRTVLEEVGAWDAYNVTEDADLGMRMSRYGYKCEVVYSTTWEEANNRPIAWVKQRSRWLKGFAMTWATHMRNPAKLWQDLGPVGFLGFQVILLGTFTSFLFAPIFWVIWTGFLGIDWAFFSLLPSWVWRTAFGLLVFGEVVMTFIATTAMTLKKRPTLVPFIFSLSFYWPLGTFAAYKALFELFFAPFYWDKTKHGLD